MTSYTRDNSAQTGGVNNSFFTAVDPLGDMTVYGSIYNDDSSHVDFDHINVLTYFMGSGNDGLYVDGRAFSQAGNSLYVDAGGGVDHLTGDFGLITTAFTLTAGSLTTGSVSALHFETYDLTLGSGNDSITLTGADGDAFRLGGGNDTVKITKAAGYQSVDGGTGFNRLTVNNAAEVIGVSSSVYSGAGDYFYGNFYNDGNRTDFDHMHQLTYTMGSGNDALYLNGNALATAADKVTVEAGAGSDTLTADLHVLTNNLVMTDHSLAGGQVSLTGFDVYDLSFGSGNDSVTLTHATGDALRLAGGNDSLVLTDAVGYASVDGGTGTNSLSVDNSGQTLGISSSLYSSGGYFYGNMYNDTSRTDLDHMHQLVYKMGSGNSSLYLDGNSLAQVSNTVAVSAGTGFDVLTADLHVVTTGIAMSDHSVVTARLSLTGFDQYDLTFGSGNDTVSLTGAAGDALRLADGDDSLTIVKAAGYESVDGGAGFDSLSVDNSTETTGVGSSFYSSGGYFYGNMYNDGNRTDFTQFEALSYKAGGGNDSLYLDGNSLAVAANLISVDAGAGQDSLTANLAILTSNITVSGATLSSQNVTLNGFEVYSLTFGSGNDTVSLIGAEGDNLSLAAGDDSVNLSRTVGYEVVDGGDGRDSLSINNAALTSGRTSSIYSSGGYFYGNFYNEANRTDFSHFEALKYTAGTGDDTVNVDGNSLANASAKLLLNGGSGDDTLNLNVAGAGPLTLTFQTGLLTVGTSTFTAFEHVNVALGGSNYIIFGKEPTNTLTGGSGDDIIEGAAGTDIMDGAGGRDTASYSLAASAVTVSLSLQGAPQDTLGDGLDTLNNFENLKGSAFNDSLTGDNGNNLLDGGAGNDVLTGLLGDDTYIVTSGDTVIETSGGGTDMVNAGFNYTLGDFLENLNLTGGANASGTGNALDNLLYGNVGNNLLNGGLGNDTMTGGAGNDTYVIDNALDVVNENPGDGTDTITSSITWTLATDFENLTLANGAAINGTGNAVDNALTGNTDSNKLTGLDGNDYLDGGAGGDTLIGGIGNDTYVVDNALDVITELNNQGTDTLLASVSWTLTSATSIEVLTLTGTAALSATGNSFANTLNGNAGSNALSGGLGADNMAGGLGNDTYTVENAGDVVTEALNAGTDTVKTYINYTMTDNVENLQMGGADNLTATGNVLDNVIKGNAGNNVLSGGGGVDKLYGLAGDDTYYIDNTTSRAYEVLSGVDTGGTDTVYASASITLGVYIENLFLTGSANINGIGNDGANHLTGNSGINYLTGAGGNDTMTGGLERDVFAFAAASGDDVITDFSTVDNDKINVNALSHGTTFGAGITITQVGGDTLLDLGLGNTVTITGALVADVSSHMIW